MESAILRAVVALLRELSSEEGRNRILVMVIVVAGVLLLAFASPLGIFFARTQDGESMGEVMNRLAGQLEERIEAEKAAASTARVEVVYVGSDDGAPIRNHRDVLAVFAVGVGYDPENAQQVMELSRASLRRLESIFWEMNGVWSEVGTDAVHAEADDERGSGAAEPITLVYVDSKSYAEMADDYALSDRQRAMLDELMDPRYGDLFLEAAGVPALTPAELRARLSSLPADIRISRQDVVTAALSLVGKIRYFWGGRSDAIGWDDRWGEMKTVTAKGSPSTGTERPFGMDCSKFTRWALINAGLPASIADEVFGDYTGDQWANSLPISEAEAQPGDLTFLGVPGTVKVNHVGIVAGRDDDGALRIVHCASRPNTVVVTGKGKIFRYFRRPIIYREDDWDAREANR